MNDKVLVESKGQIIDFKYKAKGKITLTRKALHFEDVLGSKTTSFSLAEIGKVKLVKYWGVIPKGVSFMVKNSKYIIHIPFALDWYNLLTSNKPN